MSTNDLIIIENLEMYPEMWPTINNSCSNLASSDNAKYEDVENAGSPAAPLQFPTPLIQRAQRLSVSVADHVSGRVYHEKEVITQYASHLTSGPRRAYLLKKKLATCTFGVVRLAIVLEQNLKREEARECLQEADWRSTSHLVAIKVISTERVRQNLSTTSSNPLSEVASLQLVGSYHPNVLGCVDVLQNDEELYIVTPYHQGKDLYQKLAASDKACSHSSAGPAQNPEKPLKRPSERCAREWFVDLLRGLMHLQNKGICHRNLSLENLLLDSEGKLVIADFGYALRVPYTDWSNFGGVTDVSEGTMRRLIRSQPFSGNAPYVAPELLKSNVPFDGFAVDMWSAGVILFMLLVGRAPFRLAHSTDSKFVAISHKGRLRSVLESLHVNISSEAIDLLQNLLRHDPRKRLTLQEALSHPWVTQELGTDSEASSVQSSSVYSSSVEESKQSKCVRFNPSSVCEDLNCRLVTFGEESLCRLSLGRMSSF